MKSNGEAMKRSRRWAKQRTPAPAAAPFDKWGYCSSPPTLMSVPHASLWQVYTKPDALEGSGRWWLCNTLQVGSDRDGMCPWHLVPLSRNLNQPLGHKALKKGLRIQKDGSVFVDDVIRALSDKPALRAEWVGQISRKSLTCPFTRVRPG